MDNSIERNILNPSGVCEPLGLYNHALSVDSNKLLFLSGQVAVDCDEQLVGRNDIRRQTQQVLENISNILEGAKVSFHNVVKLTVYLTRPQDVPGYAQTRSDFFLNVYPNRDYPAATLVIVQQLLDPDWLIEVDAIAAMP